MVITYWVVADSRGQEIAGNKLGALVDELVKGVLPVGARLTPDHRPGLVGDGVPVPVHIFAVALHVALLEISREAVHVLVVGQDCLRLGTKEIDVPDPDQGQQHRDVLLAGHFPEMLVHGMGSLQQLHVPVEPDGAGNGKPDGRPQGVAAAHPVPKHKHVLLGNAKLLHCLQVGRDGHKVIFHVIFPAMLQEPSLG